MWSSTTTFKSKRRDLQTCVTLVHEALQQRTDAVMAELLREEEVSSSNNNHNSKVKNHADLCKQQQEQETETKTATTSWSLVATIQPAVA